MNLDTAREKMLSMAGEKHIAKGFIKNDDQKAGRGLLFLFLPWFVIIDIIHGPTSKLCT